MRKANSNTSTYYGWFDDQLQGFAEPIIQAAMDEAEGDFNVAAAALGMSARNLRFLVAHVYTGVEYLNRKRPPQQPAEIKLATDLVC